MDFIKPERLWLKGHAELDEKWVQARIAENPTLLGLGELVLRDKERSQPRGGRLDLLLQDPESNRRYEVELQLGATDESHIIRTIEYWDLERKRYPQYDHSAVIVAEEITARFLNVISLFNGTIPLVAIQMSAFKIDAKVALVFTKVLDEVRRGLVDEDETVYEDADRAYWETRASKKTLAIADELLKLIRAVDPKLDPNYTKHYVGLAKSGRSNNFVLFIPRKDFLYVEAKLDESESIQKLLENAGLDGVSYDNRRGRYRITINEDSLRKQSNVLEELMRRAYDAAS
jgi:hypothetical protein